MKKSRNGHLVWPLRLLLVACLWSACALPASAAFRDEVAPQSETVAFWQLAPLASQHEHAPENKPGQMTGVSVQDTLSIAAGGASLAVTRSDECWSLDQLSLGKCDLPAFRFPELPMLDGILRPPRTSMLVHAVLLS